MRKVDNNTLVNLQTERDALRHASQTGSSLEGILARISAEVTNEAKKPVKEVAQITPIKTVEIDAKPFAHSWLSDETFPFTPLECWYLLRGFSIKPKKDIADDLIEKLGMNLEQNDYYLNIKRS